MPQVHGCRSLSRHKKPSCLSPRTKALSLSASARSPRTSPHGLLDSGVPQALPGGPRRAGHFVGGHQESFRLQVGHPVEVVGVFRFEEFVRRPRHGGGVDLDPWRRHGVPQGPSHDLQEVRVSRSEAHDLILGGGRDGRAHGLRHGRQARAPVQQPKGRRRCSSLSQNVASMRRRASGRSGVPARTNWTFAPSPRADCSARSSSAPPAWESRWASSSRMTVGVSPSRSMESRALGVGRVRVSTFLPSTPAPPKPALPPHCHERPAGTPAPASTALAKVICSCSGESTS